MKKYIVIYHMSEKAQKISAKTKPEDRQKSMEQWMVWAKKCGSGLVDMGAPLGNGQKVSKSGNTASKSNVVGYSILQADNIDKALKMLKNHPHLGWNAGCEIEVHETLPLPGSK